MSDRTRCAGVGAHQVPVGAGIVHAAEPNEDSQEVLEHEFDSIRVEVWSGGGSATGVSLGEPTVTEPALLASLADTDSLCNCSSSTTNDSTFTYNLCDITYLQFSCPSEATCNAAALDEQSPEARHVSAPPRGWERQAKRRRVEDELRKQAAGFCCRARGKGRPTREAAKVLGLPRRTLDHWCQRDRANELQPRPRGRPPRIASAEQRGQVWSLLDRHGPSISLATLKAEHPYLARAELADICHEYRDAWAAAHPRIRCELDWLRSGSVWAMDFCHPPHLVDGCYPAILNVLDLASHQQLLWLAVDHEDAETVLAALGALFDEHGAPLVMKCDNGPAFRSHIVKRMLSAQEVFPLYSPPYCPWYNGACERANRTLKEFTEHVAEQAGRAGYWRSDDLLAARLTANRYRRPWGETGMTPEESWANRRALTLDERQNLWQHLKCGIAAQGALRQVDLTAPLSHYQQAEIERDAAQPVLESLGLLHVTRRLITPVL